MLLYTLLGPLCSPDEGKRTFGGVDALYCAGKRRTVLQYTFLEQRVRPRVAKMLVCGMVDCFFQIPGIAVGWRPFLGTSAGSGEWHCRGDGTSDFPASDAFVGFLKWHVR